MALKPLKFITVGQLKTPHWKQAHEHYKQRLQHWRSIHEQIIKDGDAALPPATRNKQEGQKLLQAIQPNDYVICMDERGKSMTSPKFAQFLEHISENATRIPCFIIGGAYGLDPSLREKSQTLLSLGPMTFPHELARVLLFEQVYRAEAILRNIPYHH